MHAPIACLHDPIKHSSTVLCNVPFASCLQRLDIGGPATNMLNKMLSMGQIDITGQRCLVLGCGCGPDVDMFVQVRKRTIDLIFVAIPTLPSNWEPPMVHQQPWHGTPGHLYCLCCPNAHVLHTCYIIQGATSLPVSTQSYLPSNTIHLTVCTSVCTIQPPAPAAIALTCTPLIFLNPPHRPVQPRPWVWT